MDEDPLDVVAAVGPFFALERWDPDSGWRPLRELAEEPDVLRERVASARALLADRSRVPVVDIEERAAASIVFMGLAARLTSPALGAAVLGSGPPHLTLDDLWWQPVATGPWPLAYRATSYEGASVDPAAQLGDAIARLVTPILDAFATTFSVSDQVLWGNVASSLGGALTMLAAARPDQAEKATRLVELALGHGVLRGTGAIEPPRSFRRTSCCLFYRIPGAGVCGDCVLGGTGRPSAR